ncbi:sororin [Anolis sagrei]|uniref:sororin n=1 Tax=Anolis sagrei TaxID=38937 RepID=UPI003520DAC9
MAGGGRGLPRRARSAGEARAGVVSSPPRRRSERTAAASTAALSLSERKACLRPGGADVGSPPAPLQAKKPIITLRKIVPRSNRQVKETAITPRRSPRVPVQEEKENVPEAGSPPAKEPAKADSAEKKKKKVLSPIEGNNAEGADERDKAMAKRVRRSYSRLELSFFGKEGNAVTASSTPDAHKRQTLFGFDRLLMADEVEAQASLASTVNVAGERAEAALEPDTDLPGIAAEKQKRRRKKAPQFQESELDEWMAQMNAEFEEAEKFSLWVE